MTWSKIKTWLKDWALPRIIFIPYWLMRLLPVPFGRPAPDPKQEARPATLMIEAGVMGWQSIEFKEMYLSACEYLGPERVMKLAIEKDKDYAGQVRAALDRARPTHYFYDPRTGSQNGFKGMVDAFKIAFSLHQRGVVPIALLTDFSHRLWRAQTVVVTARRGVVISFLAARAGFPIFPHARVAAPSLMPMSVQTMAMLDELHQAKPAASTEKKAVFVGSLYEPRTTVLNTIKTHLENRGCSLEIKGRVAGGKRRPDEEYWKVLGHSDIILTTADQIDLPINDWQWIHQLTYRYLEAIAAGTLLVAPEVPGVRRFFIPGEHFAAFRSSEHAAEVIDYYLAHETERNRIVAAGRKKAGHLVRAQIFWVCVDIGLGKDALT